MICWMNKNKTCNISKTWEFKLMSKIKQDKEGKEGNLVDIEKKFFSTNHVLIHKKKENDIMVYLPGYLRVKFKNFL